MIRSNWFPLVVALRSLLLAYICTSSAVAADPRSDRNNHPQKTSTFDVYRPFVLENIFNYYANNGDGSYNKWTSGSALEFPRGSMKTVVYEEGVLWGGFHKGYPEPKVGGSAYSHALQAGKILLAGSPTTDPVGDDGTKPEYRVYRVRADITPITPFSEVQSALENEAESIGRYELTSAQDLYSAYLKDWNEWPAKTSDNPLGLAPFQDANGNATYEPEVDMPGQPGADQTLYYVANDASDGRTQQLAGCPPIGVEMHRTIWGYNKAGTIGNTIFATTLLINRSGGSVDSMYMVQWADPDLGYAYDDLVGCDTSLNLGFVYNGQPIDNTYGAAVPAVGYTFLQGPVVPGEVQDSAFFRGTYRQGLKNLGLSAFVMFTQGVAGLNDPRQGAGGNRDWYNLMNGRIAANGAEFIDPTTGQPTKFVMAGDPLTGTGWIDGAPYAPPQDRRMCLVTGPFTMADSDTQEMIIATTVALGRDYLNSIAVLKSGAAQVKGFLTGGVITNIASVESLYPAHLPITLRGSAVSFGAANPTLNWFVASKPAGSLATIVPLDSGKAQITPDTPGVYHIGLAGWLSDKPADTAYVDLNVTSIQRPVAAFTVESHITLGDTLTLDGTASYDPNGMAFTRSWRVVGSRAIDMRTPRDTIPGYLSSLNDPSVEFVPLRTNQHTVQLDVSNGIFTSSLVKTFDVKPKRTPNMSMSRQLTSGTWAWLYPTAQGFGPSGYYGWGPIVEFDGRIWANDGGMCGSLDFSNFEQPAQVYGMQGILFDGSQNYLVALQSPLAYIAHTDGHGGVQSIGMFRPFSRPSADTSLVACIVKPPYLLLTCRMPGVLVVDISNPANPQVAGQYFNGESWGNAFVDGTLLYAIHPTTSRVSIVDLAALPSITPVATIYLPRPYNTIRKIGQYFYLIEMNTSSSITSNADTIAIYDFSDPHSPTVKGYIEVPKTFDAYNRFNGVDGYGDKIIASTAEGVYVFDVSNPAAPTVVGSFLTGSYFGSVFMNASQMLAVNLNRNTVGTPESAYEGLLEFESPFTSVEEQGLEGVPTVTRLEQNYPNPFNPVTLIKYTLGKERSEGKGDANVKLAVYDVLGREVTTLVNERQQPGTYTVQFDGSRYSSGTYFYRLKARGYVETKKLLIVR